MQILNNEDAQTKSRFAGAVPVEVPRSEQNVLNLLERMGETHAPALARASNGSVSVAAIYSLLQRLESRGLVERREVLIPMNDITARRVFYKIKARSSH